MIDLATLTSLFVDVFGASKEWTEPKIIKFDRLSDVEEEAIFKDLKGKGHEFGWVRETRLRQLARKGWIPVIERGYTDVSNEKRRVGDHLLWSPALRLVMARQ